MICIEQLVLFFHFFSFCVSVCVQVEGVEKHLRMDIPKSTNSNDGEQTVPSTLISAAPLEGYLHQFSAHVNAELIGLKRQLQQATGRISEVRAATARAQKYLLEKMPQVERGTDIMLECFSLRQSGDADGGIEPHGGSAGGVPFIMDGKEEKVNAPQMQTPGSSMGLDNSRKKLMVLNEGAIREGSNIRMVTPHIKLISSVDKVSHDVLQLKNYEEEVEKALSPLLLEFTDPKETVGLAEPIPHQKVLLSTGQEINEKDEEDFSTITPQKKKVPKTIRGNDSIIMVHSQSDTFPPSASFEEKSEERSGSAVGEDGSKTSQKSVGRPTSTGSLSHSSISLSKSSPPAIAISAEEQTHRQRSRLSTFYKDGWKEDKDFSQSGNGSATTTQVTDDLFSDNLSQNTQKLLALFKRLRKDHEELRAEVNADREKDKRAIEDHSSTKKRLASTILELQESQENLRQISQWLGLLNFQTGETEHLPYATPQLPIVEVNSENRLAGLYALDSLSEKVEPMLAISPLLMTFRLILLKDFQERTAHLSELHHKEVGTSTTAIRNEMQKLFAETKERENAEIAARENLNEVLAAHDRRLTELELTAICRPEFVSALRGKADAFSVSQQTKAGVSEISMVERRLHRRLQELEERVAYYEAERKELREIILALLQLDKEGMLDEIKNNNALLASSPFPPFPPRSLLYNSSSLSEREKETLSLGNKDAEETRSVNELNVDPNHVTHKIIYRVMPHESTTPKRAGKRGIALSGRNEPLNNSLEEVTFAAFVGGNSSGFAKENAANTLKDAASTATAQEGSLRDEDSRYPEKGRGRRGRDGASSTTCYPSSISGIGSERISSGVSLRQNGVSSPLPHSSLNAAGNGRHEGVEKPSTMDAKQLTAGRASGIHRPGREGSHKTSRNGVATSNSKSIAHNASSSSLRPEGLDQQNSSDREMFGLTRNQEAYARYVTKDFNRNNVNSLPPIPYERRHSP